MRFDLFALYAGPDQIMTVTSGLAGVLGVLLIFWNKVVAMFMKVLNLSHRSPEPNEVKSTDSPSSETH